MMFIDPHVHMTSRTTDDYEEMANAGIVALIEPSFWLGQPRTQVGSFQDYYSSLVGWEPFRASQFGIQHYCTIGLNSKEANNEALPEVGDLAIFTNWQGQPLGIIETVSVTITPYNQISADYAALEGEGDKSLEYWQRVHWDYYQRELAGTEYQCHPDMSLVCEQFKLVFKESE